MVSDYSIHRRLLSQTEPYHFQRRWVQHSNYPRAPQPGVQPDQLEKEVRGQGVNPSYWMDLLQKYQASLGIVPQTMVRPKRRILNWRLA